MLAHWYLLLRKKAPATKPGGVVNKRPRQKYEVDYFSRPSAPPQRTDDDECLILLLMR